MKRILFIVVLIFTISVAVYSQSSDVWVYGIGTIQALWNQSLVDGTYNLLIAQNPNDAFDARISSFGAGRQDADARISATVAELCAHDRDFCAQVFQKYGVRFAPTN